MTVAVSAPQLVFFYSPRSGQSRRADGFLAQVLQRRHNHETFTLVRVDVEPASGPRRAPGDHRDASALAQVTCVSVRSAAIASASARSMSL
jgi:hypothetical protein